MDSSSERETIGLKTVIDMSGFERGVAQFNAAVGQVSQTLVKMEAASAQSAGRTSGASAGVTAGLKTAAQSSQNWAAKIGESLSRVSEVALGMLSAQLFQRIGREVVDMTKSAVALDTASIAFERFGGSIDELRAGVAGMMTDADIMRNYNLAAQLVGKEFADELPEILGLLTKAAASTGESMDYMFSSIVRGVGRLSPLILDNLAVAVKLEDAYAAYAQEMGKSADSLTIQEKQTAVLNETLRQLHTNLDHIPGVMGSSMQVFSSFGVEIKNIRAEIGEKLLPMFTKSMPLILNEIRPVVEMLKDHLGEAASEFTYRLAKLSDEGVPALEAIARAAMTILPEGLESGMNALIHTISRLIDWLFNLEPATVKFVSALGLVGIAIQRLDQIVAMSKIGMIATLIVAGVTALVFVVDTVNKAIDESNRRVEEYAQQNRTFAQEMRAAGKTWEEYAEALMIADGATSDVLETMGKERREAAIQMLIDEGRLETKERYIELLAVEKKAAEASALAEEQASIRKLEARKRLDRRAELAGEQAALREEITMLFERERTTAEIGLNIEKAQLDHSRRMEDIALDYQTRVHDLEVEYNHRKNDAYTKFQSEYLVLVTKGQTAQAAKLERQYKDRADRDAVEYDRQVLELQVANERKELEQKRAHLRALQEAKDQGLRSAMQRMHKRMEEEGADVDYYAAQLRALAQQGTDMLQLENEAYLSSYGLQKSSATAWATQQMYIYKDRLTGQEVYSKQVLSLAAQLEKDLVFVRSAYGVEAIEAAYEEGIRNQENKLNELLKNLYNTSSSVSDGWQNLGDEVDKATKGARDSAARTGESATRVMASVVDDIHKAVTAAKDAIVELVDFDVPAGVDLGLGRLADFIIISVESMYATLDPLKSKVESISKSIQPVIDMMSLVDNTTKAIEAATKGASMAMPDMDEWANRFALVVKKMVSTIVWVRDQVSQKGLDDAAAQVEKLAGVVSLVSFDFSAINLGAARFPDMQMWANRFSLAVIYAVNAIIFARDKVTQARLDDAVKQVSKAAELLSIVTTDFSKIELAKKFPDMQAWANRLIISVSMATNAILYLADLVKYDRLEEAAKQAAYVKVLLEIVNTDFSKIELAERFPDMRAWANRLVIAVSHTASAINYVVEALGTDRYGESNLAIAASFADSINALLGTVKSGVDALSAISGYSPAQNLDAKMISFATDMRDVALRLMSAFSAFTRGQGPQLPVSLPDEALEWWKDIAQLVSIVKDGVGALTSLTKYAPVQELPAKMLSFVVDMRDVAYELLRAMSAFTDGQGPQLPDAGLLKPATDWWGAVGDLVGVVKPGIDAIEGLTRYVSASNLEGRVAEFRTDLISIALELNKAVHPDRAGGVGTWPEIHDDALLWWGNVKSIVEVVKPGIDALDSLAKYSAVDDLERRMALFRSDLNQVAIHMNRAVMPDRAGGIGTWPEIREEALEWWQNVKGLIDVIKPGIDALGGLADYVVVENLEQHVAEFRSDLNQVALHMSRAVMPDRRGGVGTWPEIAEEALKWWSDVNSIIGVIKTGVDAIEALSGYTTRQGSVAEKVALLSADLIDVARTMTTMFDVWSRGGPQEIKQEALDFWDSVKSLIGVISPGVKAIADMAEFKQVKDLDTRVAGFADNVKSLVRRLIAMITAEGMPTLDVATAGAEYWSQITTILGAIAPAAAAIQNIGGSWVTEKDLESKFARFKANVVKLVTMMGELTDELESNGSIAKAKNFSQNMQDIKSALDTGLGVLQDVHNRGFANDPHTVKEVLWQFVGDVSGILSHVVTQTGDRLRELRDTFIKRIPQDSDAAYAYGYALGTSVSDGFRAGLGAIPSVIIPPVSGGGAGRNAGTVNNNSTSFSFQYLGQGASDDDMRRFGDYVIQRVTTELGR